MFNFKPIKPEDQQSLKSFYLKELEAGNISSLTIAKCDGLWYAVAVDLEQLSEEIAGFDEQSLIDWYKDPTGYSPLITRAATPEEAEQTLLLMMKEYYTSW